MCKSLLDLIGSDKRNVEKGQNLFPTSEGAKADNIQYALDGSYEPAIIYDRPEIVKPGVDPLLIGQHWIEDLYDLNIFRPKTFDIQDVGQGDISVIKMPAIQDIAPGIYHDIIKCNFYADPSYDLIDFDPCIPFTIQEKNYLDYVRRLQNNGFLWDVLQIFTGKKSSDTPIGIIGAKALQQHFKTNIVSHTEQTIAEFIETDPFRFLQTNNLLRVPYDITVPKTIVGKAALLLEKLSGSYFPFDILPNDAFDLNRTSIHSKDENTKLLLEYTGAGQKQQLQKLLLQNRYRANYLDATYAIKGNQYVYIGTNAPAPFADSFNSEYETESTFEAVKSKKGLEIITEYHTVVGKHPYQNPQYNIESHQRDSANPDLFSSYSQLNYGEDTAVDKSTWNSITPNTFDPNSVLFQTKKLVNNNSETAPGTFIDSTKREFGIIENGKVIKISKGDSVTAFGDWPVDTTLGYSVKKGDFFRAWSKDRQYSKLNRTIFHRGLDRGDTRSVLGDNGIVNIAPTYRSSTGTLIKKYMFSLENLAWNDNIADLPECEVGQGDLITGHRGRIMWFPPYDLNITEGSTVDWSEHKFIGRGESVYTYNNTSRHGTIDFSMIVDHPMVVNKLRGQRTEIWERYFKGDKSVESQVRALLAAKLNNKDILEIEKIRQYNKKPSNISNEPTLTPAAKANKITSDNAKNIADADPLIFASAYFPNNVDVLPSLSGGVRNNQGYQSDFQVDGLDFTYYKGVKRDTTYEQKTGRISYPNNINYSVNNNFFDPSFIESQFLLILDELKRTNTKKIYISFAGYASQAIPADTSNYNLSLSRAQNLKTWFQQQLDKFKQTNNIGDTEILYKSVDALSDTTSPDTGDDVSRNDKNVVIARRAEVLVQFDDPVLLSATPAPSNANDLINSANQNQSATLLPSKSQINLDDLSPDILEKLLGISECDMFEYMETYDPLLLKTISEKIKFFHPAFHSMTPEGFNGRLNFLNQCTRQGQSIGVDGIDNLNNFAFGRPPVCILKIGDFLHTKIIIQSLSINYEKPKWDLNPQGFVAPMIAKISLSVIFLGGQSITGPINRLQNALSFNFYASMEMFDPRADSIGIKTVDGHSEAQIIDGIKLHKILSSSALVKRNESLVNNVLATYGNVLPVQKINPSAAPFQDNVPTSVSSTSDIIQLKKSLNLQLTSQEKATLVP